MQIGKYIAMGDNTGNGKVWWYGSNKALHTFIIGPQLFKGDAAYPNKLHFGQGFSHSNKNI